MNNKLYQQVKTNTHFKELVQKRERLAWLLTVVMLVLYYGFILLIAFAPGWLGTPITPGSNITRGIPIGIGLIIASFLLTGIYVIRANGEFDRLNTQILQEIEQ